MARPVHDRLLVLRAPASGALRVSIPLPLAPSERGFPFGSRVGLAAGDLPERVALVEDALTYRVDVVHGQKTGFYLDQRDNRRRIRELEAAILDNPSAGNYEGLADLYLEERKFARARDCYDKSISSRTDSPDPFYRRAIAAIGMADFVAAVPDLERVVARDPKYDFQRAAGLLAHAYANTGQADRAEALFREVTRISTLSETYYNFACLLQSQQRDAEAREWAQRILAKKPTMPGYLKRRERSWFRKANGLLKRLPA